MRFKFDLKKSSRLRKNPRRAIGFEEVQEIWTHPYYLDCRSDVPEQFRAIGWVKGELYSVIFEVREDAEGEYHHLITLWKATKEEQKLMTKTLKRKKPVSADSIGKRAERGEDVSRYFTNAGRMMPPVQRVNVDFAQDMLNELDVAARELNVSRQAVIKIFVRQALNQHYMAQKAKEDKAAMKRA